MKTPASKTVKELQLQIVQLLGWTRTELSHYIFETGIDYLHTYFGNDIQAIDLVKLRKEYWTWFLNQWYYRDKAFIETLESTSHPDCIIGNMYNGVHNPDVLASYMYPPRQVLGADFPTTQIVLEC